MKQIKLVGFSILFLSILSCGQTAQKNKKDENYARWELYVQEDYSIQYPKSWRLDTSGIWGTEFAIFSAQSSLLDKFIENVKLEVFNLPDPNIDLAKYVELSEEKIEAEAVDGDILESEQLTSNGTDFHKLMYTVTQGIHRLKMEQYYWVHNDKAYVITLSCKVNEFKRYQTNGEKMMNSFKLK